MIYFTFKYQTVTILCQFQIPPKALFISTINPSHAPYTMHLASFYFSFYIFLKATPVTEQLTPVMYLHLALFSFSSYNFYQPSSVLCIQLIVFPQLSYSEALDKSGLNRLDTRCEEITKQIFRQTKSPTHPLHYLIPPPKVSSSQMILRPTYPYPIPKCKKTRYGKDFIPYCIARKYQAQCVFFVVVNVEFFL